MALREREGRVCEGEKQSKQLAFQAAGVELHAADVRRSFRESGNVGRKMEVLTLFSSRRHQIFVLADPSRE